MLFLVHQFTGKLQGRADVFDGQVVLSLHFLEAHPARQAAYHDGHRHPRAANHRFAMTDIGVYDDSIDHRIHQSMRRLRDMQVHAQPGQTGYGPLKEVEAELKEARNPVKEIVNRFMGEQ